MRSYPLTPLKPSGSAVMEARGTMSHAALGKRCFYLRGRSRFQLLGTSGLMARVAAPRPGGRRPPELRLSLHPARPYPPAARGSAQKLKPQSDGGFPRPIISSSLVRRFPPERTIQEARLLTDHTRSVTGRAAERSTAPRSPPNESSMYPTQAPCARHKLHVPDNG